MISRAIPYEGKEPYIFLSYCHKDAPRVYPMLERMVLDGYRVWYDDGNHAGDDWLENIATHLNECSVCLAMISEQSAASHNCKSEISEAISWEKKLLAVMLEDFQMPLGMRLQLSTIHYLKKSEYPMDALLLEKLYQTEEMALCKQMAGSLPLRKGVASLVSEVQQEEPSHVAAYIEQERRPDSGPIIPKEDLHAALPEPEELPAPAPEIGATADAEQPRDAALLIRLNTGEHYALPENTVKIGRSAKLSDIVLQNGYIGKCHAKLEQQEAQWFLEDLNSANGTFAAGRRLVGSEQVPLSDGSCFRLYNEYFVLLQGRSAAQMLQDQGGWVLRNPNTAEVLLVCADGVELDRGHTWAEGTLSDKKISRSQHAAVRLEEGELLLIDRNSRNGTFLNNRDIRGQEPPTLAVGDKIRLGDTILEVDWITLQGDKK